MDLFYPDFGLKQRPCIIHAQATLPDQTICIKVKAFKFQNIKCSIKRKELQNMCITNAKCNLTLAQTVTGPKKGHGVAGRAGRNNLDYVDSCRIGALTIVVQVVLPQNTVANWSSPLKSPLDVINYSSYGSIWTCAPSPNTCGVTEEVKVG